MSRFNALIIGLGALCCACSDEQPPAQQTSLKAAVPRDTAVHGFFPTWTPDLPVGWTVVSVDTVSDEVGLGGGTTFHFANNRAWEAPIIRGRVLGALASTAGRAPYFAIAGWPCDACDAPPAVWIASPDDAFTRERMDRAFAYPGEVSADVGDTTGDDNFQAVFDSRMLIGECVTSPGQSIVWLERVREGTSWVERVVVARVADTLHVDTLAYSQLPADSVDRRLGARVCREVPPVAQTAF